MPGRRPRPSQAGSAWPPRSYKYASRVNCKLNLCILMYILYIYMLFHIFNIIELHNSISAPLGSQLPQGSPGSMLQHSHQQVSSRVPVYKVFKIMALLTLQPCLEHSNHVIHVSVPRQVLKSPAPKHHALSLSSFFCPAHTCAPVVGVDSFRCLARKQPSIWMQSQVMSSFQLFRIRYD